VRAQLARLTSPCTYSAGNMTIKHAQASDVGYALRRPRRALCAHETKGRRKAKPWNNALGSPYRFTHASDKLSSLSQLLYDRGARRLEGAAVGSTLCDRSLDRTKPRSGLSPNSMATSLNEDTCSRGKR